LGAVVLLFAVSMRAAIIATAAAVVIGLWLFAPKPTVDVRSARLAPFASSATLAPISVWDMHNRAALEGLPEQQFEDLSFVFTESGDKQALAARLAGDTVQRQ